MDLSPGLHNRTMAVVPILGAIWAVVLINRAAAIANRSAVDLQACIAHEGLGILQTLVKVAQPNAFFRFWRR